MTNGKWLLLVIAVIGISLLRECQHNAKESALEETIASIQSFMETEKESFTAQLEVEVQARKDMEQRFVSTIDDLEEIKKQYQGLKDISSIIKAELHTKIKGNIEYKHDTTWLTNYPDSLIPIDSVKRHFVPKGTTAEKHDIWYDISLTLDDSLRIDSLLVREKIDAVLGWKKPDDKKFKFLRKRVPVVSIQSYNPYSNIGYVNNLVVKDEKSKFVKVLTSKPMMFLYGVGSLALYQSLK